ILPHFEAWIAQQGADAENFRQSGNHVVITGASRTADIGMELVLGAHGPADLHIIIL
ncbi:MAG: LUD domain-containing protein, partial [Anaerolineae bacterium]|nr:LUD domain-containing protein [Anaerolineae bacterium]